MSSRRENRDLPHASVVIRDQTDDPITERAKLSGTEIQINAVTLGPFCVHEYWLPKRVYRILLRQQRHKTTAKLNFS
jgi:hypothetical protein